MNREFNLSETIQHNRDLVTQGIVDRDYAQSLNEWLIHVNSLIQLTGKPFYVAAALVPAPYKAFTTSDCGSVVTPPRITAVTADGVELVF